MSEPVLLRAEKLRKEYADGKVTALDDASLTVTAGEFVAIMGASGSGKSTLLNILGALDRPSSGEVYFRGEALSTMRSLDEFRSAQIGFVFQSFLLLPSLSAQDNVQIPMFSTALAATERARRAAELLQTVGMGHRARHRPIELSAGERQRVAIARALANDPPLVFADEPTGNLDTKNSAEIMKLFVRLNSERGKTLLIITHSHEVAAHAKRVVTLRDGRIISDEPVRAAEA